MHRKISVIHTSGNLNSLHDADGDHLCVKGRAVSAQQPPVWLVFDTTLADTNPTSLDFYIESMADTRNLMFTVEMWNWTTKGYQVIGTARESVNVISEELFQVPAFASDFVQPNTGTVRTRVGWQEVGERASGFTFVEPPEVCIDRVFWMSN